LCYIASAFSEGRDCITVSGKNANKWLGKDFIDFCGDKSSLIFSSLNKVRLCLILIRNYLEKRMDSGIDVLTDFVDVLLGFTGVILFGSTDRFNFDHRESV